MSTAIILKVLTWKVKYAVTKNFGSDVLKQTIKNFLVHICHVAEVRRGHIEYLPK
jgi:hypothetical protein